MNKEVIYEQRRINWYQIRAFKRHGPEGICFWCRDEYENKTQDHVIPRSRIGPYYIDYNKVDCCQECNTDKGNMFPSEWRKEIEDRRIMRLSTNLEKDKNRLNTLDQLIF